MRDKLNLSNLLIAVALVLTTPTVVAQSAITDALQGDWTTYRFRNQAGFAKTTLHVEGRSMEQVFELIVLMPLFPSDGLDIRLRSEINDASAETDSEGRTVNRLQMRLTGFAIRFNSVREAGKRSRSAYCGINQWVAGTYVEIAGLSCREDDDGPFVVQPAVGDPTDFLVAPVVEGRTHVSLGLEGYQAADGDDIVVDWEHALYRLPN